MRISERKRATRTPDTSESASRNMETQRNNQRSLLEGGVGSLHTPVSALSLNVAIRSEWGKRSHYPSPGSRQLKLLAVWMLVSGSRTAGTAPRRRLVRLAHVRQCFRQNTLFPVFSLPRQPRTISFRK